MIGKSSDQSKHDKVLEEIAKALDIPPSAYEEAVKKYKSLGKWLERTASTLVPYEPEISPQGSFLLGTVIKPLSDEDEYDVDLVCRLRASKHQFSQKELKEAVGNEVKSYAAAQNMKSTPEERRRCWTVLYVKGTQFHLDVLPSIPDADTYRMKMRDGGYTALAEDQDISEKAIAITDWNSPDYEHKSFDWPSSNPFGYYEWFRRQMAQQLSDRRQALFDSKQLVVAKVNDIPEYRVKTTLQQAIQLLKRHRDEMFAGESDHKPISIIITTLAAHAYGNEARLSEALLSILQNMDQYIEDRGGVKWVSNPVNPKENFADKWQELPEKQHNFFAWLRRAKRDFAAYLNASPSQEMPVILRDALGERYVNKAIATVHPYTTQPVVSEIQKKERIVSSVAAVHSSGSASKPWAE